MEDEAINPGLEAPEQTQEEAAPNQEAASSAAEPQYITREDFDSFANELLARMQPQQREQRQEPEVPDPIDDPAGYADYIANRSASVVEATIQRNMQAQQAQQQVVTALGGADNVRALLQDGYTMDDLAYVAQNPQRAARMLRSLGSEPATPQRKQAPRSEGGFQGEGTQMSGALQAEIDASYAAYSEHFDISKADYTKMILAKQGRRN